MREKVEAASGEFPAIWKPRPGDILEGSLVRYEPFKGNKKATPCDVAVIHDDEAKTEVSLFLRNVVLVRLFKKWRPEPGEYVCLRYIGEASDGKTKLYELAVDRDESKAKPYMPTFDTPQRDDEATEQVTPNKDDLDSIPF